MSNTPDPLQHSVGITWREIYDAVVRLTGRVDVLIIQNDEQKADVKDHEMRIRQLESNRWPLPTLGALTGIAALILTLIKQFAN